MIISIVIPTLNPKRVYLYIYCKKPYYYFTSVFGSNTYGQLHILINDRRVQIISLLIRVNFPSTVSCLTTLAEVVILRFYPPKGRAKRNQWGPLDSLSILYVIEKPKFNFQKHERGSAFFETSTTFIVWVGG